MCTLLLGIHTRGDDAEYRIPCESRPVALEWVEKLAAMTAWPKTHVARLEFWPDEAPLVIRLDNVFSATVITCESFVAYERARRDAEENEPEPETPKENS